MISRQFYLNLFDALHLHCIALHTFIDIGLTDIKRESEAPIIAKNKGANIISNLSTYSSTRLIIIDVDDSDLKMQKN